MGVQGQGLLTLELFICMQVYRIQVIIFGGIYDIYNNIDLSFYSFGLNIMRPALLADVGGRMNFLNSLIHRMYVAV